MHALSDSMKKLFGKSLQLSDKVNIHLIFPCPGPLPVCLIGLTALNRSPWLHIKVQRQHSMRMPDFSLCISIYPSLTTGIHSWSCWAMASDPTSLYDDFEREPDCPKTCFIFDTPVILNGPSAPAMRVANGASFFATPFTVQESFYWKG